MKGSPVYPFKHTHLGVWLITWHSAFLPHISPQGLLQLLLIQARWSAHSLLLMHLGRQLGGVLIKFGRHEQDGEPSFTLHKEFGPQGLGWHGFIISIFSESISIYSRIFYMG